MLVLVGCSPAEAAPQGLPLTAALLALAPAERAVGATELERIAQLVRRARRAAPQLPARALLRRVVFEQLGFAREVSDASLRFVYLPSVLRLRRGSCVGLGSLYLALGERLGWNMRGVIVPGHFFVRIQERGVSYNLELLRGGAELPDSWYHARYPVPVFAGAAYARPLYAEEVAGVVEYDVGNARMRQGKLLPAQLAYERARRLFPDFAEAHASAGSVAQLLGQLSRAQAAYRAARRANPQLAGVEHNLALLEAELAQHTVVSP